MLARGGHPGACLLIPILSIGRHPNFRAASLGFAHAEIESAERIC